MSDPELDRVEALARIDKLRADAAKALAEAESARRGVWRQPTSWVLLVGAITAFGTAGFQWNTSKADSRNAEADVKLANVRVEQSNLVHAQLQAEIDKLAIDRHALQVQCDALANSRDKALALLNPSTASDAQLPLAIATLQGSPVGVLGIGVPRVRTVETLVVSYKDEKGIARQLTGAVAVEPGMSAEQTATAFAGSLNAALLNAYEPVRDALPYRFDADGSVVKVVRLQSGFELQSIRSTNNSHMTHTLLTNAAILSNSRWESR